MQEKATFGAGCFWSPEAEFAETPGVTATEAGYSGGDFDRPTYDDVCAGVTGHAEVVQVTFDPAQISYEALVEKFFLMHDPTQMNRQGPDIGAQYRSVIFYHSPEQEKIARAVKDRLQQAVYKPIVTAIEPAKTFWRAEEFHQKFWAKRGGGSCRF